MRRIVFLKEKKKSTQPIGFELFNNSLFKLLGWYNSLLKHFINNRSHFNWIFHSGNRTCKNSTSVRISSSCWNEKFKFCFWIEFLVKADGSTSQSNDMDKWIGQNILLIDEDQYQLVFFRSDKCAHYLIK